MAKNRTGSALLITLLGGLATATIGCGDDGNGLSDFVGTWTYTQSTGTFTCPGTPPASSDLAGRKVLRLGISSDLVDLGDNCNYRFDVQGKIATIQAMQTCTFSNGDLETPSSWRFSLLSPTTADETVTTSVDDLGLTCLFMAQSTLTKVSKD